MNYPVRHPVRRRTATGRRRAPAHHNGRRAGMGHHGYFGDRHGGGLGLGAATAAQLIERGGEGRGHRPAGRHRERRPRSRGSPYAART
ncbi:hypothetical protein QJS66_16165 [Kocuria rhizophila]|nr:hypothetical protein QJS66_16165 [Kocuria rhizophila]